MAIGRPVRPDRSRGILPGEGRVDREAKKICESCEVRSECLQYALENDERFGIWGGLSERERRRLRNEAV